MGNLVSLRIKVGPIYSSVAVTSPGISAWPLYSALNDALAVRVPGYMFSEAYKSKRWDGYKRFFNPRTGSFPTGLLPKVVYILLREKDPDTKKEIPLPVQCTDIRFVSSMEGIDVKKFARVLLEEELHLAVEVLVEDESIPLLADEQGIIL